MDAQGNFRGARLTGVEVGRGDNLRTTPTKFDEPVRFRGVGYAAAFDLRDHRARWSIA